MRLCKTHKQYDCKSRGIWREEIYKTLTFWSTKFGIIIIIIISIFGLMGLLPRFTGICTPKPNFQASIFHNSFHTHFSFRYRYHLSFYFLHYGSLSLYNMVMQSQRSTSGSVRNSVRWYNSRTAWRILMKFNIWVLQEKIWGSFNFQKIPTYKYRNGVDQRTVGQRLRKHGPTSNNRSKCVFYVFCATQQYGGSVLYVVWAKQQHRGCDFCVWSVPRRYKVQRSPGE